jgi:hypothetical protein
MTDPSQIKIKASQLETPFMIQQVETHLVFGPLSRHLPLAYAVLIIGLASLVAGLLAKSKSLGQRFGSTLDKLLFLTVPFLLLSMTKRQQAIVGWIATKIGTGFAAFLMATVGSGISFQHGYADAWPNLFLGLIWIPSIEFIPRVTPHQRYVTLARILFSIPCIYFGVRSGNWHWS